MTKEAAGVLIMAGGTGGHIFPGLAVAESLRSQRVPVRWLGARGGMECQRVPAAGFTIDVVQISGVRGKGLTRWLGFPVQLIRAISQAFVLIGKHRPACALSFGGYAAAPGGLAARLRGIPLLVHEQNRVPGLTNRALASLAHRVFEAFPGTWPKRFRAVTCGNPVRHSVTELAAPAERMQCRSGKPHLLITGGSQGASALNQILPPAVAHLTGGAICEIRHQAGRGRAQQTAQAYAAFGVAANVEEFIEDMAGAYAWADLVVCRAGALTVSELAAAGVAAVFVPYPHAVDDHQTRNAEYLVGLGAAHLLPEAQCDPGSLGRLLQDLLSDRQRLLHMANLARGAAIPDAADCVAQACMEFATP